MNLSLDNFLSISSEPLESSYLIEQFKGYQVAIDGDSYNLAILAYHLIFLSFYNQILFKIKKFLPKEHDLLMVSFDQDRMKQFQEAKDPTSYAHSYNKERSMFELLDIFPNAKNVILKCKKRVDYRNKNFGHVSYIVIDESSFYKQVEEYNFCCLEVTRLYSNELKRVFEDWINDLDDDEINYLTKDDIETGLIVKYKLSLVDIKFIEDYCTEKSLQKYKKIKDILNENYDLIIRE